jgi:putative Holliday junction resolvase
MARVMAIDYGTKRVGIAVTDSLQIIATGLTTVGSMEAPQFIFDYLQKEEVEMLVVGEARRWNNELNEVESDIQSFLSKVRKLLPDLPVKRVDERFTSSLAMDSLIAGGVKKKDRRKKELLDEVSATIILQSYLSAKNTI